MKRALGTSMIVALCVLAAKTAHAQPTLQLAISYPGASCSTANGQTASGGPLHFYGPEMWNQSNQSMWVECPIPADLQSATGLLAGVELDYRGPAPVCSLAITTADGDRWVYANNAVGNTYGRGWTELLWTNPSFFFQTEWQASVSLDCNMPPGSLISMYRVTVNQDITSTSLK